MVAIHACGLYEKLSHIDKIRVANILFLFRCGSGNNFRKFFGILSQNILKEFPKENKKPATRAGSIVYYVGKTDSKRIH